MMAYKNRGKGKKKIAKSFVRGPSKRWPVILIEANNPLHQP